MAAIFLLHGLGGRPITNFDGCVYRDEAGFDAEHHSHLPWADHRTVFGNPRLRMHVHNVVRAAAM